MYLTYSSVKSWKRSILGTRFIEKNRWFGGIFKGFSIVKELKTNKSLRMNLRILSWYTLVKFLLKNKESSMKISSKVDSL